MIGEISGNRRYDMAKEHEGMASTRDYKEPLSTK